MDFFTFLTAAVAMGCATPILLAALRRRETAPDNLDAMQADMERMRERIEALETILTDQRERVRREIEELK